MPESPHRHIAHELAWATVELQRAGVDTPQLDATVLLAHCAGLTRTQLVTRQRLELTEEQNDLFRNMVSRRCERSPLPYLIGRKEFWGLEFEVNASTLIPRPETEVLVEAAAEWLRGRAAAIAEIGVGSGAIAVALAKELSEAVVYGTEISPGAASTAMRNVERHSVANRVKILTGDLTAPLFDEGLSGRIDALVSNPPYVSSDAVDRLQPEVLYEPREAIIAGPDALHFHKLILADAPLLVKPGGRVFLEIDHGQGQEVAEIANSVGTTLLETRRDLAGLERVVILECVSSR